MRWPRPLPNPTSTSLSRADHLASLAPHLTSLRLLHPLLHSHTLTEALLSLSSPLPAFRLYLLAYAHPHLRSKNSTNRIARLFLHHPESLPQALDLIRDLQFARKCYLASSSFEPLITAYAQLGQTENAVDVFERMLLEFRCPPNSDLYSILLRMFVENGLVFLALAIYNRMLKLGFRPSRSNYVIIMDGLCKAGMVEDALHLFDEMTQTGVYPDARVYNIFITASSRSGKLDDVARLLHSMKDKGCEPRDADYNAVLSGLCKLGRVDDAFAKLALFQDAGFVLGLEGYSSLIDGLLRVGRFNEALRYFHKMLNANVKPDTVLYTIMIKGYAGAGRVEDCFTLLNEMTDQGLVPDTFCYNTLIKALCDAGQIDRARSLQLEMSNNGLVPDSATHTIMLGGLCNAGMVDEAQKLFGEMPSLGMQPTIYSYNSLINVLCKAGRMNQAQLLLYKMEMGRNPFLFLRLLQGTDQVRDSVGLRKLIDKFCQSGQVLKAYKLLHGIRNSGVMPDIIIYNTLINGFCKLGDIDGALKLFKELQIKGHSPDEFTYCTIANGLLRAQRVEDANKLLAHLVQTGFKPIVSVHYQFMKSLGRKRKVMHTVKLWLDYLAQECTGVEVTKAISDIKELYEKGSLKEAVCGLLELDRINGSVGPDPYTLWITGFCLARRVDDAIMIYELLREYGIDLTPASCGFLIRGLSLTNNLGLSAYLVLYSIKKKFLLLDKRGIDCLVQRLCLENKRSLAELLVAKLCVAGYNLEKYITKRTKLLLLKSEANLVELRLCRG